MVTDTIGQRAPSPAGIVSRYVDAIKPPWRPFPTDTNASQMRVPVPAERVDGARPDERGASEQLVDDGVHGALAVAIRVDEGLDSRYVLEVEPAAERHEDRRDLVEVLGRVVREDRRPLQPNDGRRAVAIPCDSTALTNATPMADTVSDRNRSIGCS